MFYIDEFLLFAKFVLSKMNCIFFCIFMYTCSFVSECFNLHCASLFLFSKVHGNKW